MRIVKERNIIESIINNYNYNTDFLFFYRYFRPVSRSMVTRELVSSSDSTNLNNIQGSDSFSSVRLILSIILELL